MVPGAVDDLARGFFRVRFDHVEHDGGYGVGDLELRRFASGGRLRVGRDHADVDFAGLDRIEKFPQRVDR
ncbi:hypothetical protein D3C87_1948590 [compost metagenome]